MTLAYEMHTDGTSKKVHVSRNSLSSDSVYCIIDDSNKNIYVWMGKNADVRKRFVGAQTASYLRNEQGTGYRVRSEDEGSESKSFLNLI